VLLKHIRKGLVGQFLNRRHPVAAKLGQLVERVVVEGDQFAQASSSPGEVADACLMRICRNRSGPEPAQSLVVDLQRRFPMVRISAVAAIAAIAISVSPAGSFAQSAGTPSAALPPAPGTNSAGTAQSSGSGMNTGPGVTTGSTGSLGTGMASAPQQSPDAAINEENKTIDRKLKGICRGC